MELLRKVAEFTKSIEDKSVVRHSYFTEENALELQRIQKASRRLIIAEKYENFEDWLCRAKLKEKSEKLCKTFAIKCAKSENPRLNNIFSKKEKKRWNGSQKI